MLTNHLLTVNFNIVKVDKQVVGVMGAGKSADRMVKTPNRMSGILSIGLAADAADSGGAPCAPALCRRIVAGWGASDLSE